MTGNPDGRKRNNAGLRNRSVTPPQGVMEDNLHRHYASEDDDPADQPAAHACQYVLAKAVRSISGDQARESRDSHRAADEAQAYRAIRLQVILRKFANNVVSQGFPSRTSPIHAIPIGRPRIQINRLCMTEHSTRNRWCLSLNCSHNRGAALQKACRECCVRLDA